MSSKERLFICEQILRSYLQTTLQEESESKEAKKELTREEILKSHKAKVAQHRDGRWRTYVPTFSGKHKLKVRTTREKLEDDIVEAYLELQEAQEQENASKEKRIIMNKHTKDWLVRFVRKDGKPDEEYYYNTKEEAEYHRNLFQDDDSGLYEKIEIISNGATKERPYDHLYDMYYDEFEDV